MAQYLYKWLCHLDQLALLLRQRNFTFLFNHNYPSSILKNAKNYLVVLFLTVFASTALLNESQAQVISGTVISSENKAPIPFTNVLIPSVSSNQQRVGVSADDKGVFMIAVRSLPIELEFSAVGFSSRRVLVTVDNYRERLTVELTPNQQQLESVVISSEKLSEQELRAPIEISRLSLAEIQTTPSFNFYDAVGNLKGVDLTTQSVVISSVNTRGFNSTSNQRFKQFTDGIDSEAPGLSFSLGNIIGPSALDVESLNLIPGPSTALFGPSAFNGVLDMKTKNPFDYQGFTFNVKGATASIDKDNQSFIRIGNFISDLSARYAVAYKDKIGFKISTSIINGVDFRARDYSNIGSGDVFAEQYTARNQGINGVNVYGDDRASIMVVPLRPNVATSRDTAFSITRQGYREEDLVNYKANNIKFNTELQFKFTEDMSLSLATFYGKANSMITGIDRLALRDFAITQHKLELNGKNFLVRGYTTQQNSGNTFNVGLLADRLLQIAKPNEIWFDQFQRLYSAGRGFTASRSLSDSRFPGQYLNRFEPETTRFDSVRTAIIRSGDPNTGAAIIDESKLYHVDARYDLKDNQQFFDSFFVGGNARLYDPESAGTIFTDSLGNDVTNFQYGFFTEMSKDLDLRTNVTASLRYDKNENFDAKFSQRLSVVHQLEDIHYFRFSAQRGFRLPNINEQFLNQNIGEKRVIGGLQEVTDVYDLHNNAFLLNALDEYNNRIVEGVANLELEFETGKLELLNILEDGIIRDGQFTGLKPEQITSFELGYRSLVEGKRLFEVTFYRNYYKNFIGNLRVIKPRTSPTVDLARAAEQANNPGASDIIFVAENSNAPIITQGIELLYDYTANSGTYFTVNATFANIIQDSDDPLTPGFNTPPFKWNAKLGHRRITENFAAELTWRSRSNLEWRSPFIDGEVEDFSTFDIQFTFKIPDAHTLIKVGGNNMYNIDQYNSFGGPEINAFYYVSLIYDPFQSR